MSFEKNYKKNFLMVILQMAKKKKKIRLGFK